MNVSSIQIIKVIVINKFNKRIKRVMLSNDIVNAFNAHDKQSAQIGQ